ncbi:MAG: hypothetical protein WKF94_19835, partial [Solirubrobacteraceae bacterium]
VLLSSVDVIPALQPVTVTGGRVNAARAVQAAASVAEAQTAAPAAPSTGGTGAAAPAPSPAQTPASPLPAPPPPAPDALAPAFPTSPPGALPAVATAVDRKAPGLAVSTTRELRVRTLRAKGLRATVNCSEACRLSVDLTLDRATARRLGLRSRRVALRSATISRAGRRVIALRPTAAARARLRLRGSGRATLRVTARDAAGNRRTNSQTISLRP